MNRKPIINISGKSLCDYSHGVIFETYAAGDAVYYASCHPELCPEEDGLDATGRYLVVLLQPNGLFQFHVVLRDGKWIPDLEEYGDNQVDEVLENIMNQSDDTKELHPTRFTLPVSQEQLDWISDCIIRHTNS